jgi:hypothetical protein
VRLKHLPLVAFASTAAAGACGGSGPTKFACPANDPDTGMSDACTQCIAANCDTQASSEFGPDWQAGNVTGGECTDYVNCLAACPCSSSDCPSSCQSSVSSACYEASENLADCLANATACSDVCITVTVTTYLPDGGDAGLADSGSIGSSAQTGDGGCAPCGTSYVCTASGSSVEVLYNVSPSSDGTCTFASGSSAPAMLLCGGNVQAGDESIGTWSLVNGMVQFAGEASAVLPVGMSCRSE